MDINKRGKSHDWNDFEDDIIMNCVRESPHNISKALSNASQELNIDIYRCKNRWYKHLIQRMGGIGVSERKRKATNDLQNEFESSNVLSLNLQVRETLDGFLETMKGLQKQNKMLSQKIVEQDKRLTEQSRLMRDMALERKDLEESYTYILKVMEKARKMFAEDEVKEAVHKVDSYGSVEITKTNMSEQKNNAG